MGSSNLPAVSGDAVPPAGPSDPAGVNNVRLEENSWRVIKGASYRDLSTVIVLPTPTEFIHGRVEAAIDGLMRPMNQKLGGPLRISENLPLERLAVAGCEVADAYNQALTAIAANPDLSTWRFLLTVEHDNLPPPDGLIRLQARMYENARTDADGKIQIDEKGIPAFNFLAIGGLYWTKGFGTGMPMIYGHPRELPINFRPQPPLIDALQECRGVAMGFTLWNLQALLKDPRLKKDGKWFTTKCSWDQAKGVELGTQDLVFCTAALQAGYRFAVDTAVKVGHYDFATGVVF
jgi:hypothetical protein